MKGLLFRFSFLLIGVLMISATGIGISNSPADLEKVILVDLDVKTPQDAPKAYSTKFDRKRIELDVPYDDKILTLEDYSLAEDALEGPDCFFPQLKMIFRTDTYVFSLYCTRVIRYKNQSPYVPSGKRTQSDIKVTQSVLSLLQDTYKEHFGDNFDLEVANRFVKREKLKEIDNTVDDSSLLNDDEDSNEDKDLEKDATDKEGWFDNRPDPGLEDSEEDKEIDLDKEDQ